MKVIKQLFEDEFVIKMEEHDLKSYSTMRVAHDYVEFGENTGITTENDVKLYGKFVYCSNWIKAWYNIQIPIRTLIKVVLPHLNKHKYCQEEHLLQEDGKPAYNWETEPFTCKDEDDNCYVYVKQKDGEFCKIPLEVYNQIKNS